MDDDEKFYDLKGYEGFYKINKLGQVKSLKRTIIRKDGIPQTNKEMILKPCLNGKDGDPRRYFQVGLQKNGKKKTKQIHRLLAETFLMNPKNLPWVDHKNQNTQDNRLENIRWTTPRDNNINRKVMGKIPFKFICEEKQGNRDYFVFQIRNRKEKNIKKRFNKKKYTLQQVIEFRDNYCKENDIEIIE